MRLRGGRNRELPILAQISSSLTSGVPPESPQVLRQPRAKTGRALCADAGRRLDELSCGARSKGTPSARERRRSHPPLTTSVRVDLRSLHLKYRDFTDSADPPILHRKEEFVPEDYPRRSMFAALTVAEEAAGLYANPESIGSRERWQATLCSRGLIVRGHEILSDGSGPL